MSLNLRCCGGNRFIFELGNRLVDRGYAVSITHAGLKRYYGWFNPKKMRIIDCGVPLHVRFLRKFVFKWFDLLEYQRDSLVAYCPDCDVNVATYCLTAEPVLRSRKGRGFYLVQHYEPTFFPVDDKRYDIALDSYRLGLKKLCVSKWLTAKVGGVNIGNGINLKRFIPDGSEKKFDVLMSIRDLPRKKPEFNLQVKEALESEGFSVLVLNGLFSDAAVVNAYRTAKILVYLSDKEGFGYVPLEAMGCGCPVVVSDCTEYVKPEFGNGFVLPSNPSVSNVVSAVQYVLGEKLVYDGFVEKGLLTAKEYDFERVVDRFERAIR